MMLFEIYGSGYALIMFSKHPQTASLTVFGDDPVLKGGGHWHFDRAVGGRYTEVL